CGALFLARLGFGRALRQRSAREGTNTSLNEFLFLPSTRSSACSQERGAACFGVHTSALRILDSSPIYFDLTGRELHGSVVQRHPSLRTRFKTRYHRKMRCRACV
ncbi:unnamed protein product, partial [Hapterophycus canaliculatus]